MNRLQGDCAAIALVMLRANHDWPKYTPSEFLAHARMNANRARNDCKFTPLEMEEIAQAMASANHALCATLPPEVSHAKQLAVDACKKVLDVIERVENRCMACDGPVTPTTQEITEDELRTIYLAAKEGALS